MIPWCGECDKPVQKIMRRIDFWTGQLVYIVQCHGLEQRQYLPCPHDLQELTVF